MPKRDKGQKVHTVIRNPSKDESKEQCYGEILKILGGNRMLIKCEDGQERQCTIRGNLQRFKKTSTKINIGDLVLITVWNEKTGEILNRYSADEVKALKKSGELQMELESKPSSTNLGFDFDTNPEFDFTDI